jgi:hypothetical protein
MNGMNKRIIIALRGKGDSGKTTTIVKLYSLISPDDFTLVETNIERPYPDYRAIFKHKDLLIGITSKGDTYDDVSKDLKWLIGKGCHLLICACRTKDRPNRHGRVRGSNTAIDEYEDHQIIRLNKSVSGNPENHFENEANNASDAQRLLAELLNRITTLESNGTS